MRQLAKGNGLYRNFKFKVKCNGKYVAGFNKMSTPMANGAVTFELGLTKDVEFDKWARRGLSIRLAKGGALLRDLKREVTVEVYGMDGKLADSYRVSGCWASEYQALPDLDANANAVSIEHIVLECEGWQRDTSSTEPPEP